MTNTKPATRTHRFYALASVTLAAAAMRLIPHPPNFTPIAGIALFGGAHFHNRRAAFGVPLAAMLVSDLLLGLAVYGSAVFRLMPFVYLSFALMVCLGRLLSTRRSIIRVGFAAVAGALLFYGITNFGVWLCGNLYPRTWEGLIACYVAAIPYLRNAVAGNLVYTAVFFGGFALAQRRFAVLRDERTPLEARA
jgi:hypothetical protein